MVQHVAQLRAVAHQDSLAPPDNPYPVVRDQPMSARHQVQGALALADAGLADQEQPDPVHVNQGAVQAGLAAPACIPGMRSAGE